MDDEARRVRGSDHALDAVVRRADRRRVIRRATGTFLALAIAAGGIGLAYATFQPGGTQRPAGGPTIGPTPGPTPSGDAATPAAIEVEVANASTDPRVPTYVASFIEVRGRGVHHGGYRMVSSVETEGSEVTTVLYEPGFEAEAERMSTRLFSGAATAPDGIAGGAPLRVVVGQDFAERHATAVEAFELVRRFGAERTEPGRADLFLGPDAATYYHGSDGGLYGYAKGCPAEVWLTEEPTDPGRGHEFYLSFCRRMADSWTERVRVAPLDGGLRIVEAMLVVTSTSG
jgi:hypothetical protein